MGRLLDREVERRLARLLLELAQRFGEGIGRGRALGVRLSQQDLSCMVACTREAVSKVVGEFREAGLIETPRPCGLVVVDEPKLREVAAGRTTTAPRGSTKGTRGSSGTDALGAPLVGVPVVP